MNGATSETRRQIRVPGRAVSNRKQTAVGSQAGRRSGAGLETESQRLAATGSSISESDQRLGRANSAARTIPGDKFFRQPV